MLVALIVILFATAALGIAVLGPVVFRLFQPCSFDEIPREWLEDFKPSSYYPMQRLLSDEDFRFLARQPGFDLSLLSEIEARASPYIPSIPAPFDRRLQSPLYGYQDADLPINQKIIRNWR